jgi:triphosphatase
VETEIKYTVSDPTVFAALLELEALGAYALRPQREGHLIDHYVDTPNRDLLRGGYTCRLREGEAEGRWLLTVKELGNADGAMHQREEHEAEVPPNTAPAEWPESPAREIVTRLSEGQALAELFTLRQHRARRAVDHDERAIGMLSLDTVGVEIGGHQTIIHEVEIELTANGTVDDLQALSHELQRYKLEAQSKSKFERALAILDSVSDGSAAKKRKMRPDEPLAEAGRKILRVHFLRMLANEDGTRTGTDIEAVHDMRVATRRQRAIFRIVAPYFKRTAVRPFRDELRTLAGHLGAVRDLDVLIDKAEDFQSSSGVVAPDALEPVLDDWRKQRSAARAELLTYLNGDAYQAFTKRYKVFLSSTGEGVKEATPGDSPQPTLVRHILPAKIWSHYGKVRAYETVLATASIETLHALRIEGKRLRYLLEFFGEVLGTGHAEAIKTMIVLQDHLGELHDSDVTVGLLRNFLMRSAQAPLTPMVAASVEGYLKIKRVRVRTLQRTFKRPWRQLTRKRFRKLLARMVAEL